MKKIIVSLFISLICATSAAYAQTNFDIISPFKIWLLNNEATVMKTMSADTQLCSSLMQPFAFMQAIPPQTNGSEEELWSMHRKFYILLDEIQNIYVIAKRYGSGKFAIILKQARPEYWGLSAFNIYPSILRPIMDNSKNEWRKTLLVALELNSVRDANLGERLKFALSKLSKDEIRIFNLYLNDFSALYPSNNTGRIISSFMEQGSKTSFGAGVTEILKFCDPNAETSLATFDGNIEDTLEQLEELAGLNSTEQPDTPNTTTFTEEPDENSVDDFNIW